MNGLTVFLDDGGVMNDNAVRVPQWQRLVAEYLAPRLGGDPRAWAEANRIVAERVWRQFLESLERAPDAEFAHLSREFNRSWLAGMCEIVGVDTPQDDQCIALTRETSAYVTRRVRAAYPGAVDAIRGLHGRGYALSTASGEISPELDGYLEGMGVRDLFSLPLFGPDLVNEPKNGARYYRRIFAHGADPSAALVVDDDPHALDWAAEAGAMTVLVSNGQSHDGRHRAIRRLAELPDLLAQPDSGR